MKQILVIRRIVGLSMAPLLNPGQIVIAVRLPISSNAVVIARQNNREVIKRVVRLSRLPSGSYEVWLQGDNPTHSSDSRKYGFVPAADILGVVVWPRGLRNALNRV